MTAREEINLWMEQGSAIKDDTERELFLKEIHKKLSKKTPDEHRENLIALKAVVVDFRKEVKTKIEESEIKVYPSSCEEREFLKNLFSKMNIRFKLG